MLSEILLLLTNAVSSCLFWALDFFNSVPGVVTLILTGFMLLTAVRLLIAPFIGAASSDVAQSRLSYYKNKASSRGSNKQVSQSKSVVKK